LTYCFILCFVHVVTYWHSSGAGQGNAFYVCSIYLVFIMYVIIYFFVI